MTVIIVNKPPNKAFLRKGCDFWIATVLSEAFPDNFQRAAFQMREWCHYCKATSSTSMQVLNPRVETCPKDKTYTIIRNDPQTQMCKLTTITSQRTINIVLDNLNRLREAASWRTLVVGGQIDSLIWLIFFECLFPVKMKISWRIWLRSSHNLWSESFLKASPNH